MGFDFSSLLSWETVVLIVDLGIVWYLIYRLLKIVRNTKSVNILNGVLVILVMKLVSSFLGLQIIDWVLGQIIDWSVIAVIVIFQPEIRRGLEHIGRNLFSRRNIQDIDPTDQLIQHLVEASQYMSKRRIGALIVLEKETNLQEYIDTGIDLGANTTNQLLINIFIPNTPLHDGAVIIRQGRIESAASYLPLSDNPNISKELGTRHRAAIGMTEVSDALVLIVSEETGDVSLAKGGQIERELSVDKLDDYLHNELVVSDDSSETNLYDTLFKDRGDKS